MGDLLRFHISITMETQSALCALASLAQESRLAIFRALVEAGPAGLSAGKISKKTGISLVAFLSLKGIGARRHGRFTPGEPLCYLFRQFFDYECINCISHRELLRR
jgi:hypothetical protein